MGGAASSDEGCFVDGRRVQGRRLERTGFAISDSNLIPKENRYEKLI
jgi:hypothetical protein